MGTRERRQRSYVYADDVLESWLDERPGCLIAMFLLAPEKFLGVLVLADLLSEFIGRERAKLFETNDGHIVTLALRPFFIERVVVFAAGE